MWSVHCTACLDCMWNMKTAVFSNVVMEKSPFSIFRYMCSTNTPYNRHILNFPNRFTLSRLREAIVIHQISPGINSKSEWNEFREFSSDSISIFYLVLDFQRNVFPAQPTRNK